MNLDELLTHTMAGDQRALAQVISAVTEDHPGTAGMLGDLYLRGGRANVVGISVGSPGRLFSGS